MTTFVKRSYSGDAKALKLKGPINSTTTTFDATGTFTGWPTGATGPFFITMTRGFPTEEKMTVSAFSHSSGQFTVTRGADGTPAVGHVVQGTIELTWSKTEAQQANTVVHTVNTIQSATDTYVPVIHTASGTKVFEYVNPGLQFGLNSEATFVSGLGSSALAGTHTTGAKADHRHRGLAFTGALYGSVATNTAAQPLVEGITGTYRSNSSGVCTVPFSPAFTDAVLAVSVLGWYAGVQDGYTFKIDTTSTTLSQLGVAVATRTGSAVQTATVKLTVLAMGV